MSKISKSIFPIGTSIVAISPTILPISPFPIGELKDILPSFIFTSFSGTIENVCSFLIFWLKTLTRVSNWTDELSTLSELMIIHFAIFCSNSIFSVEPV